MLHNVFTELLLIYTDHKTLKEVWNEIEHHYSDKNRFYHTLDHLDYLLSQLIPIKGDIRDWETVLFTLFYHDIIYNVLKHDNEEKSAELAIKRMKQISVLKTRQNSVKIKFWRPRHLFIQLTATPIILQMPTDLFLDSRGKPIEGIPKISERNMQFIQTLSIIRDVKKYCPVFWNRTAFLRRHIFMKNSKRRREKI